MGDYESGYDPKYGYNRNAFAHPTLVTGLLGRTVRLIAAPIGLVSEAVHNRKDKKRGDSQSEGSSDESSSQMADPADDSAPVFVDVSPEQAEELIANKQAVPVDGEKPTHELVPTRDDQELGAGADDDDDEADWALDDAATAVEDDEPDGEIVSAKQSLSLTGLILSEKKPTSKSPSKPLPSPVVTPQRRPGTKARGFVRAYAPVLQDSGIDHETFLGFLKEFHKAAQAHPIFDVLMVATAIAGFYPDPIIDLGIQAAQIAVAVGQEIQERWYLNKFLEQANKDLFVPNGLVALVVTYTPANNVELEIGTQTVDIGASAVAKYGDSVVKSDDTSNADAETKKPTRLEDLREKSKRMRIASGKTRGEVELPAVCAPLIFPTPDTMEDKIASKNRNNPARFADDIRAKTKSSSKYVQDYFDRRAQTTYAGANPNSQLANSAGPSPQFKSRFADPNNATNTHFFTLITGGHYKAEPLGARRRYEKAQRQNEQRRLKGLKEKSTQRNLGEGILYLTIVNIPSEAELEKAKKDLEAAKARKAAERKEKLHGLVPGNG